MIDELRRLLGPVLDGLVSASPFWQAILFVATLDIIALIVWLLS